MHPALASLSALQSSWRAHACSHCVEPRAAAALTYRHPQAYVGAFLELSAARPALCTALCRYDCAEVALPPHGMSSATLAALRNYCHPAGSAGCGAVLVHLPAALVAAAGAGGGASVGGSAAAAAGLAEALPAPALRSLAQLLHQQCAHEGQGAAVAGAARGKASADNGWGQHAVATSGRATQLGDAALQAMALATAHLLRCGVAADVLPTLQLSALGVEGMAGEAVRSPAHGLAPVAATAAPARQSLLLDDRALATLHVLHTEGGARSGSLLAALDSAASAAGRRALRRWLCRPLTAASHVEERLAVVDLFKVACGAWATAGAQAQTTTRRWCWQLANCPQARCRFTGVPPPQILTPCTGARLRRSTPRWLAACSPRSAGCPTLSACCRAPPRRCACSHTRAAAGRAGRAPQRMALGRRTRGWSRRRGRSAAARSTHGAPAGARRPMSQRSSA